MLRLARRRPLATAAVALVLVVAGIVAAQPLGSPWWSGYDFDTVYASTGLELFRGEQSKFFDHPGAPLQEVLGAALTLAWAADRDGDTRSERATEWVRDLDSLRPLLRGFGALLLLGSALVVLVTLRRLFGSALLAFAGAVAFLAAPTVAGWAAVVRPDAPLAALSIAAIGTAVLAFERRRVALYAAAGAIAGFALSVKLHAAGLLPVLALAALWRPPTATDRAQELARGRAWVARNRRWLVPVVAAWVFVALLLGVVGPHPELRPTVALVAALALLAAGLVLAVRLSRRSRLAGRVDAFVALLGGGGAGLILPNLTYPAIPPSMTHWMLLSLTGRGVNTGAHPVVGTTGALKPWLPLAALALVGLVLALRARERSSLLWALAALAMGGLAFMRYGELHYYASGVALLVPLALRGIRWPGRLQWIGLAVLALALVQPLRDELRSADERGQVAVAQQETERWVRAHLRPEEVALTQVEGNDYRYFYLLAFYATDLPAPQYRLVTADAAGLAYAQENDLHVRYLVAQGPDARPVLGALGLDGAPRRVADAPGYVFELS